MALIITKWSANGKRSLGNNLMQIGNAISVALILKHRVIKLPKHFLLNTDNIIIEEINHNENVIKSDFWWPSGGASASSRSLLKEHKITTKYIYNYPFNSREGSQRLIARKYLLNKYCKNILNLKIEENINQDLYIYIRSGDVFHHSGNLRIMKYIQPPLSYYTKLCDKFDKIILVAWNKNNPCIEKLLSLYKDKITFASNRPVGRAHGPGAIRNDLNTLLEANHLVMAHGTFSYIPYYFSVNLKKIYHADFLDAYNNVDIETEKTNTNRFKQRIKRVPFKKRKRFMLEN